MDDLKEKARVQQTLLQQKQVEADQALVEITQSMQRASTQKTEVEKVKADLSQILFLHRVASHPCAGVEEKKLSHRKKGIEQELSGVQPLVDAAKQVC